MNDFVTKKMYDENGILRDVKIYLYFSLGKEEKEYMIYSFEDIDENDLITLLVSSVSKDEDGNFKFSEVENEEDWKTIKTIMRKIIKE